MNETQVLSIITVYSNKDNTFLQDFINVMGMAWCYIVCSYSEGAYCPPSVPGDRSKADHNYSNKTDFIKVHDRCELAEYARIIGVYGQVSMIKMNPTMQGENIYSIETSNKWR